MFNPLFSYLTNNFEKSLFFSRLLFIYHISFFLCRLDPRRREEAKGLHRAEWPPTQQAPPLRGAQPMAAVQREIDRCRQKVQNGCTGHQGEVGFQQWLV